MGNHLPQCLWFSNSFFTLDGCPSCVLEILRDNSGMGVFYDYSYPCPWIFVLLMYPSFMCQNFPFVFRWIMRETFP